MNFKKVFAIVYTLALVLVFLAMILPPLLSGGTYAFLAGIFVLVLVISAAITAIVKFLSNSDK